jgi:hypothetical protein
MKPARGATGVNHDFNFYNAAGQVWDGAAFVAWDDADYEDYRVAVTELGASGRYPVPTPPAGAANWELRVRGGSLATSYVVYEDVIRETLTVVTDTPTALTYDKS